MFLSARKIVPSELDCGSEDEGIYFEGGIIKKCKKQSTTTITPILTSGVPIASFTKDDESTKYLYAPSPSNAADEEIRTLKVPLLTPMWFDYSVEDDKTWLRATEGASYWGMLTTSNATRASGSRDTTKTYWVQVDSSNECRVAESSDFNNDGSFKSSVNYWLLNAGTKVFNYAYKHLVKDTASGTSVKTESYTMTNGTAVTVNFLQAADNHKIILIGNSNCKVTVGGSAKTSFNDIKSALTNLLNDVEIGTAWYFIVDPTQKVFVLPRARYGFTGGLGYVKTAQSAEQQMYLYFHAGVTFETGEEEDQSTNIFDQIYPVGSIYISVSKTFDPNTAFKGTWYIVGSGRCLWGCESKNDSNLGENIAEGLPNITGMIGASYNHYFLSRHNFSGALYSTLTPGLDEVGKRPNVIGAEGSAAPDGNYGNDCLRFNASRMNNSVYGKTTNVQPPALGVLFWCRIA